MKQLIACCGLDCETCDARIATINNDDALRETTARLWAEMNNAPDETTARLWAEMNNAPDITAETINCMGCRTDGVKFGYCSMCEMRSCAAGRGLATCGECAELDTCPKIAPILEHSPDARRNLAS